MSKNQTKITAEPGKQELFIVREFDAPREQVFKAFTDAKLYTNWIGPKENTTHLEIFEPKTGGRLKYISKDKSGKEFRFNGVFHEVKTPERMIGTFEFEGLPERGHVELDTSKFEELPNDRTKLTIQAVYQSVKDRDAMMASGMEKGVQEGFERLDAILEKELVS